MISESLFPAEFGPTSTDVSTCAVLGSFISVVSWSSSWNFHAVIHHSCTSIMDEMSLAPSACHVVRKVAPRDWVKAAKATVRLRSTSRHVQHCDFLYSCCGWGLQVSPCFFSPVGAHGSARGDGQLWVPCSRRGNVGWSRSVSFLILHVSFGRRLYGRRMFKGTFSG